MKRGKPTRKTMSEIALKFGDTAQLTAETAYYLEKQAATVRMGDEKNISEGDTIQMQTPNGDVFGYAKVTRVDSTVVWDVMDRIRDTPILYSSDTTRQLLDSLNKHYDGGWNSDHAVIAPDPVKVIIYVVKTMRE